MEIEEIEQLVNLAKDAKISELTVVAGTESPAKVTIRKSLVRKSAGGKTGGSVHAGGTASASKSASAKPAALNELFVTAQMVGIFHGIESMNQTGVAVKAGQVIGSIESMKLMNDVVSNHNGVISEVLIEDGMPVEYGQQLFKLDPLA